MTNEEAILHIKAIKLTTHSGQMHRACDIVNEALEKQVPKRLKNMGGWYACPACFQPITNMEWDAKYSAHLCGQLVIWEDKNDK